ncbi:MAG: AI-2E family transporter, partial [Actinomycetota bacterium]|nr:AI-2E family transporter [Actinomycetota bacterium]
MRVSLTNQGLLRAVLLAFALLLVYQFLAAVVATVLLLATGLLLAVALSAPVELLHRRKVPRPAAVTLIVLVILAALGLGGYLLLPVLAEQISQLASYLPDALSQLVERLRNLASRLGIQTGGGSISPSTLASIGRRVLGGILGIFSGFASFLTGLIVVLFVPLYLAAMPDPVERWVVRLFPPGRREKARKVLSESRGSLLGWLGGRLFSMLVVGVLSTIALYVIGIPGALFLGIFSGLVAFVPIIGSVAGAVPPLVLAFAGNPLDVL